MQIKIGTRVSKLALIQAEEVRQALLVSHVNLNPEELVLVPIKTTGDKILNKNLYDVGGKGLFIKEIEEALLDKSIDIAVHSMKDMPAFLPEQLVVNCILEREDPRDAFLSFSGGDIASLSKGASVGTCAPRRAAQFLHLRPDVQIVTIRGNVDTRIEKLEQHLVDATILAVAGLKRCQIPSEKYTIISEDDMLPAIAQGAIGVECRKTDDKILSLLSKINHQTSFAAITAERGFLEGLNASCKTPIAAYATISGDQLYLRCLVSSLDGKKITKTERLGKIKDGYDLGLDAATQLKNLLY